MKERKETLSPTFLQTIASYKSPLTAFGEGLMKVGETNQKIHDTIWEHDLRQERLERERALHDMQVEAHELKMRRENFQQYLDEEFGRGDRQFAQQAQKAGIANTNENTRSIKIGTDRKIFDNTIQDIINTSIGNGSFANGNLTTKGEEIYNRYIQDAFNQDLPQNQRIEAFDMMTKFENALGQYRLSHVGQPAEWDEKDKKIYNEWLNIDEEQIKKNPDGTISITGADRELKAQTHARPFLRKYFNEYNEVFEGNKGIRDFGDDFYRQFINNANSIASRNGWNRDNTILANRRNMALTNQFLGEICKDFDSALNATGLFDNQARRLKDYTTGNKVSQKAIGALMKLRTAAMTKMYFGGNASNRDLQVIQDVAPSVNQNDIQSLQLLNKFIKAEIAAMALEVSPNPLEAYAKYGEEYAKLQSLSVLLDALIDNKIYYGSNGSDTNSSDNLSQFQPNRSK